MGTLNKEFYLTILHHLQEAALKKQEELWWECSWFLHHNNVLVHIVLSFQLLTPKNKTSLVWKTPVQPWSLSYGLFPVYSIESWSFWDSVGNTRKVARAGTHISSDCIKKFWVVRKKHHWDFCADTAWDNFEGNNIWWNSVYLVHIIF
jgi:hypothetical protein